MISFVPIWKINLQTMTTINSNNTTDPSQRAGVSYDQNNIIPGQYIISFNRHVRPDDMAKLLHRQYGAQVQHVYNVRSLRGIAISISDENLARFQADQGRNITGVQPNRMAYFIS